MGTVAFTGLLVLHVVAIVGMAVVAALQLSVAPAGPLKRFKWGWLPSVGGAALTGLLLWPVAVLTAHAADPVKMLVKIGIVVGASVVAARFHAAERAATPWWVVPTLVAATTGLIVLSLLW